MDVTAAREKLAILRRPYSSDPADRQEKRDALKALDALCPALSAAAGRGVSSEPGRWGRTLHAHIVIDDNNVAALRELMLVDPPFLMHECAADLLCPPLVQAIKHGRAGMVRMLLMHRATLPLEDQQLPLVADQILDRNFRDWGTPLTAACMMGRLDLVTLVLDAIPEVDINDIDYLGFTPFISAAAGFMPGMPGAREEAEGSADDRVATLRLLMDRGADVHRVRTDYLHYDETLEKRHDPEQGRKMELFRPRPGGRGNALSQAMGRWRGASVDPSVLRFLVEEAGVSAYTSHAANVFNINRDRAFITPLGVGARYGNHKNVEALLSLFSEDEQFRLLASMKGTAVPEPRPTLEDNEEMPVLLPIHAALLCAHWPTFWTGEEVSTAVETVRVLLANPKIREATINTPCHQHTPLHMATGVDRIPLLLELIRLGADMDTPRADGRGIVLALFSSLGHVKPDRYDVNKRLSQVEASTDVTTALKTLLDRHRPRGISLSEDMTNAKRRHALINEVDENGHTALHYAMTCRMEKAVAALLAWGAETNARSPFLRPVWYRRKPRPAGVIKYSVKEGGGLNKRYRKLFID